MSPTIVDLTSARPDEHQKDSLDGSDHLLQDALSDANRDRLYETLLVLCRSNDIAQRVKDMLLVGEDRVQSKMYNKKRDLSDDENDKDSDSEAEDSEDEVEDEDEGDESDESTSANDVISTEPSRGGYHNIHENRGVSGQVPTGLKRLRSRYAECHNCSEEFDVTQNQKHDCIWHPGKLSTCFLTIEIRRVIDSYDR